MKNSGEGAMKRLAVAGAAHLTSGSAGRPEARAGACSMIRMMPQWAADCLTTWTTGSCHFLRTRGGRVKTAIGCTVMLFAAACGAAGQTTTAAAPTTKSASSLASQEAPTLARGTVPAFRHIVLVVMENHSYGEIIGNPAAMFINGLANHGALFTQSFVVTHPSQPNYLALFSGSMRGITDDSCLHTLHTPNLAAGLAAAGKSFTGYAEGLPSVGSPVCASGDYARKHTPWTDFAGVAASDSRPFSAFPTRDLAALPTVSWVIPNLCHDMHNDGCDVATGDAWLRDHLGGYAQWARRTAACS